MFMAVYAGLRLQVVHAISMTPMDIKVLGLRDHSDIRSKVTSSK